MLKQTAYYSFRNTFYSACRKFNERYNDDSIKKDDHDYREHDARIRIDINLGDLERLIEVGEEQEHFESSGPNHAICGPVQVLKARFKDPSAASIADVFYKLGEIDQAYYYVHDLGEEKQMFRQLYAELVEDLSRILAEKKGEGLQQAGQGYPICTN